MYRGICFGRATFWVCGSAFLLAIAVDVVSKRAHDDFMYASKLEREVALLRARNDQEERRLAAHNAAVFAEWYELHPDDPEKAVRESALLLEDLIKRPARQVSRL